MSRSSDARAAVLVLGLLTLAGPGLLAAPAVADETPPPTAHPRIVEPHARVIELTTRTQDVKGTARTSESSKRLDVTLNSNVLFGKDSAALLPAAQTRLAEIGAQLKAKGPGTLTITGYTDDLGSAEHGLALSKQRAEAVRTALAPQLSGITVSVAGKGEADPAVPNKDEKSRAQNRRVELHFTRK
ncbi:MULTISPECIES: OmpA family protein [unclassified Luteococcus]|uniref:OmpA family protein n=1 Tax=unclassified Luteococcus TaxID=2639923 RepID=UPI00313CA38B